MINDPTDFEPVLGHYDPEKVLVGPVLHLSPKSNFRFLYIAGKYIAGKGGKIFDSVGLGFVNEETDAQNRRTDIVARLERHFGEVKILDSELELAREAYALWPNEETARFLATAALEAKLPGTIAIEAGGLTSDGNPAGGEAARDPIRDAEVVDPSEYLPLWARAAVAHPASTPRQVELPDNATSPLAGGPAVTGRSTLDNVAAFGEVKDIDSGSELPPEAEAPWSNQEAMALLVETAILEAKLRPTRTVGRNENCDQSKDTGEPTREPPDTEVRDTLADADASEVSEMQPAAVVPPASISGPVKLPDAFASWPLNGGSVVPGQQRSSAPEQDGVALAVLRLKSSMDAFAASGPDVNTTTLANNETVGNNNVKKRSMAYRLCAVLGAATLVVGVIVLPTTRQISKDAGSVPVPAPLIAGSVIPSIATSQIAKANDAAPQPQPAPSTVPPSPPSQTAEAGGAQAQAEPLSGLSPTSQAASTQMAGTDESASQTAKAVRAQIGAQSPVSSAVNSQAATAAEATPSQAPDDASAQAEAASALGPQSPPSPAVLSQTATAPDASSSPAADAPRAQAGAAPVTGPQSPPSPAVPSQAATPPAATPSQEPDTGGAHAEAVAVSGPPSPLSPTVESQAAIAPEATPSQAPDTARAHAEAASVSGLQSPSSSAVLSQAAPAPDASSSPAPDRAQIGAAAVLGPQSPPSPAFRSQAATGPAATLSQAPDAARAQAEAASASGAQSPPSPVARSEAAMAPEPTPSQAPDAPRAQVQLPSSQMADAQVGAPSPSKRDRRTPANGDQLAELLGRSTDFLKTGDFAAARILLRRAAETGSAEAALMLGKTFDPLYLREVGAIGIQPDIEQCRRWYEKATELGSEAAAQRLANLTQTGR
jgi:hypothetical protein